MKYRFVFYPAIGATQAPEFKGQPVSSLELAEGQMNIIANYTLHLHENNLMTDFSNTGYIERRGLNGDWEELSEDEF